MVFNMMKNFVRLFAYNTLGWLYRLLSLFYKGIVNKINNKPSIVFVSFPDLTDNSLQLFLHINKHYQGYDLVWLCNDLLSAKSKLATLNCSNEYNHIILVTKNSVAGLLQFAKAKVVFHTHGTYFFVCKAYQSCVVNLWHGMQIKAVGYLDNKDKYEVAYCDYSISTSSFHRTKMAQAFGIDESKVLLSGQPRNDVLLQPSAFEKKIFYTFFNIELDNQLVFWLPTYRVSNIGDIRVDSLSASFISDFYDGFLHDLNAILAQNKQTLIIKLHPMDADNLNPFFDKERFSHIRIINSKQWAFSQMELYSALAFSSGLISDVSSVIVDYVLTKKPIAIIKPAVLDYSRGFVPGLSKSDFLHSFFNIDNVDSFASFLCMLKGSHEQKYASIFNEFDYNDGGASTYLSSYFMSKLKGC